MCEIPYFIYLLFFFFVAFAHIVFGSFFGDQNLAFRARLLRSLSMFAAFAQTNIHIQTYITFNVRYENEKLKWQQLCGISVFAFRLLFFAHPSFSYASFGVVVFLRLLVDIVIVIVVYQSKYFEKTT